MEIQLPTKSDCVLALGCKVLEYNVYSYWQPRNVTCTQLLLPYVSPTHGCIHY